MNVGNSRRAAPWAVVLLAAGAVCFTSCASEKAHRARSVRSNEHAVVLTAEPHGAGRWKAIAHPDFITIDGYDPETPNSVLFWAYGHKSTHIRFADYALIPDPDCVDAKHLCTLRLPKGLVYGKKYKYTITGKLDDTTDLDPNDPWIEVDR